MERLNIALIHLDVRHADPERNRAELLRLNRDAASCGAQIIVNTEMAVSGYSFRSPEEVLPFAETKQGTTLQALARIARDAGCYIVLGYAEIEPETGILYNSAAVLGPDGELLLNYRKVTAEARWACPGSPLQDNIIETPWGRVALLICSDTYYALLPRMSALRGADLFIVTANWPGGSLDPREIWQARAFENGSSLVACNRTGKDRSMECFEAFSCAYDSAGNALIETSSPCSAICHVELPLVGGRLVTLRERHLSARIPSRYRPIYLDMRYAADMTLYHGLPAPEALAVRCLPGSSADMQRLLSEQEKTEDALVVLPLLHTEDAEGLVHMISVSSQMLGSAICFGIGEPRETLRLVCCMPDGTQRERHPVHDDFMLVDLDHARIALVSKEELLHPETATALAKQGCDIAVVPALHLDRLERAVLGSRSIEQLAIAACGANVSFVCMPPVEHYRWEEKYEEAPEGAVFVVDIEKLRKKHFFDRVDYRLLLQQSEAGACCSDTPETVAKS